MQAIPLPGDPGAYGFWLFSSRTQDTFLYWPLETDPLDSETHRTLCLEPDREVQSLSSRAWYEDPPSLMPGSPFAPLSILLLSDICQNRALDWITR
jgi:hypothetical protein